MTVIFSINCEIFIRSAVGITGLDGSDCRRSALSGEARAPDVAAHTESAHLQLAQHSQFAVVRCGQGARVTLASLPLK